MRFAVAGAVVLAVVVGCSSKSTPPVGKTCLMNSECANPLSCTFGRCHAACAEARDCPTGQLCVKSPTGNVCQQPEESTCQYRSQCAVPLICALDRKCRSQCLTDVDCPTKTQKCIQPDKNLPDKICAEPEELDAMMKLKNAGATPVPEIPDGGIPGAGGNGGAGNPDANMSATGGSGGGAGGSGGGAGVGGTLCTSPQTTFGNLATGDMDSRHTSGVGVRSGNRFLIFNGLEGQLTKTDGGPSSSAITVQAFDLDSGKSQGPAAFIAEIPNAPYFIVQGAAVAPTGEIVVLHSNGVTGNGTQTELYASFFNMSNPDGGAAGVGLVRTVKLESVQLDTPRIVWSAASSSFVASWQYHTNVWSVRVRKFLPDSRGAGGDTNIVPAPPLDNRWSQGNVAVSGKFYGTVTIDTGTYYPWLTILDGEGNQVGKSILLHMTGLGNGPLWATVGGTAAGFVTITHQTTTAYQVFVPINGSGGVVEPADAGVPDGGTATFPVGTFLSNAGLAHMISDDLGGSGGVLLEPNGASFIYYKADGVTRLNTGTVISSSNGAQANISAYRGSFAVSLYDGKTHSTQVVASGCGP
jgi:hypothetical protein